MTETTEPLPPAPLPAPQLRFIHTDGPSELQRAKFHRSPLYDYGDARLVWVNEGDLALLQATGIAIEEGPPRW